MWVTWRCVCGHEVHINGTATSVTHSGCPQTRPGRSVGVLHPIPAQLAPKSLEAN
jgi:hypothetical protein